MSSRTPRSAVATAARRVTSPAKSPSALETPTAAPPLSGALPLAAALFALALTALVALWAQTAFDPRLVSRHGQGTNSEKLVGGDRDQAIPLSAGQGTEAAEGRGGGALPSRGHGAEDPGEADGRGGGDALSAARAAGRRNEKLTQPEPFLSDLLPDSSAGKKQQRPLTGEEKELSKAEAVFKSNMIRRNEMTGGVRPSAPYRGWNAGRLREVFLAPLYPCSHASLFGSREHGKWICNGHKLKSKPVVIYSFGNVDDLSFEGAAYRQLGCPSLSLAGRQPGGPQEGGDTGEGGRQECEVHVFNPGMGEAEARRVVELGRGFLAAGSHLHTDVGVGSSRQLAALRSASPGKEFLTLPQIMEKLGHRHVHVLKLDCDGCEERIIPELAEVYGKDGQQPPPFSQILVEIHQARHPARTLSLLFALEDMGYRLFHVEADRRSSHRYELAFVHESFLAPHARERT